MNHELVKDIFAILQALNELEKYSELGVHERECLILDKYLDDQLDSVVAECFSINEKRRKRFCKEKTGDSSGQRAKDLIR